MNSLISMPRPYASSPNAKRRKVAAKNTSRGVHVPSSGRSQFALAPATSNVPVVTKWNVLAHNIDPATSWATTFPNLPLYSNATLSTIWNGPPVAGPHPQVDQSTRFVTGWTPKVPEWYFGKMNQLKDAATTHKWFTIEKMVLHLKFPSARASANVPGVISSTAVPECLDTFLVTPQAGLKLDYTWGDTDHNLRDPSVQRHKMAGTYAFTVYPKAYVSKNVDGNEIEVPSQKLLYSCRTEWDYQNNCPVNTIILPALQICFEMSRTVPIEVEWSQVIYYRFYDITAEYN